LLQLSIACSGALLGLSISAPVGPMGLLCIDRTLKSGIWAGVSTGAGATTVQVLYCCILLLTLDQVGPWLNDRHAAFSILGAAVTLFFAWRLTRTPRKVAGRPATAKRSLAVTYLTAAAFNATNPMLMLLLLGGIATMLDPASGGNGDARLVIGGLFLGSMLWWFCLSGITAMLRGRMGPSTMGIVNKVIATILLGFSAMALARAGGLLA